MYPYSSHSLEEGKEVLASVPWKSMEKAKMTDKSCTLKMSVKQPETIYESVNRQRKISQKATKKPTKKQQQKKTS